MFHIVYFLNFDNVSLIEIKYNKTNTNKNVIMLINVLNINARLSEPPNKFSILTEWMPYRKIVISS